MAELNAKISPATLRGGLTVFQLEAKHGIHQTTIAGFSRQATEALSMNVLRLQRQGHDGGR